MRPVSSPAAFFSLMGGALPQDAQTLCFNPATGLQMKMNQKVRCAWYHHNARERL
jgi:hypothetical protein